MREWSYTWSDKDSWTLISYFSDQPDKGPLTTWFLVSCHHFDQQKWMNICKPLNSDETNILEYCLWKKSYTTSDV